MKGSTRAPGDAFRRGAPLAGLFCGFALLWPAAGALGAEGPKEAAPAVPASADGSTPTPPLAASDPKAEVKREEPKTPEAPAKPDAAVGAAEKKGEAPEPKPASAEAPPSGAGAQTGEKKETAIYRHVTVTGRVKDESGKRRVIVQTDAKAVEHEYVLLENMLYEEASYSFKSQEGPANPDPRITITGKASTYMGKEYLRILKVDPPAPPPRGVLPKPPEFAFAEDQDKILTGYLDFSGNRPLLLPSKPGEGGFDGLPGARITVLENAVLEKFRTEATDEDWEVKSAGKSKNFEFRGRVTHTPRGEYYFRILYYTRFKAK